MTDRHPVDADAYRARKPLPTTRLVLPILATPVAFATVLFTAFLSLVDS